MKTLEDYTPNELATLSTIIGIIIASKYNVNQQNVVANFLFSVAQAIFLISAQIQNIQAQEENQCGDNGKGESNGNNVDLQKQIDELKEHIKRFEDSRKS
ncbi:hypothetical protein K9O30_21915 [Clostridium bowmanii]|uniref:hypothetical protein n=1 Tax=Clostridium bowmanii TaxID=132925 RepID=UPI001C0BA8B9|nr:hypothetical protein [Clostridium bowmanii]MBU3192079.1 hypothetical protein [Clostridium bowmanii]MCA1076330.1 hypothetical protein [Clostridium bowmanii]